MRRTKNTENNTQSIKRFLTPQSPALVKKKRRKDTMNGDQNSKMVGGLASSKHTDCGRERPSSKSNDGGKPQNASNTEASGTMSDKKVDCNSFVTDHGPLCETRYPVKFNTFKTKTYCEHAVRKILEDIKQDTGMDFLNDDLMQERVMRNYYKYFYEQPQIRDVYKLEIKACPTFVKKNILKIPNKLDAEKELVEYWQYPDRSLTSGTMSDKKVAWNSLVTDHGPLCEMRYPVTFNTFKTTTYCEHAVRKILEDIKQDTGIDFLNDAFMQERVMRNYYKYFYEQPQIRDVYKLEIKACPIFVKKNILKIPNKLDAEKAISTNTDPTVPLEPAAHAELLCPLRQPKTAAMQSTQATHKVLSQQNASSQTKRQTTILRVSNITVLNDTAFLLRHIKRQVQDTEKQQIILERIKSEFLHTQCNPQETVQNVPKEKITDAEQPVISPISNSESIVINVVKQRLQQVKDLYFREYVKSNLLPYALRMCKGLKRQIIITILKMTFEEFTKYTHIYNGAEIYEDSELLGGYYDYAIKEPQVWPINLYMNLEDLCEFLKTKSITITKQNLIDIPPILLHWEELAALTSFDKIARLDYYRCKGEKLNKEDTQLMNAYRKVFYAKCWHQNTWLRMVPQLLQSMPVTNDERQEDEPKPISKESVREQEVSTNVERRANVVEKEDSEKTLENAKCTTKNAADTAEREQPADTSADCAMRDVSAQSKSTALDTGIQNQALVALIEEERIGLCTEEEQPESSQTTAGTATSIAVIDSQLFSDLSVQDIAIQQRLQSGKELYFKEVAKSCTLPYILRCYRGLKRRIITAILNMTFTEFQQYTNIYDGAEIYKDTQLLKRCYDYTFKEPQVWPVNLYMRLGDLFQFLQTKQITLTASDLQFVSPKFLHWQDLIATTNYKYIVYWDYYRNSGKQFDSRNTTLHFYYQAFYAKCWHQDKWIWHTPRILPDVLSDCGVAVCVTADDNENIAFERKVVLHALKRQQVAEISESTVTGVVEHIGQTHAVAVVDVEIQTTQGHQEAIRPKEIMTSVGNTPEASEHNVRDKVATVDAEIQTTRNLLEPTHAADTHVSTVMQNSMPCPPLPACAIKEEKLTPLNKLEFNLTADDGDNYECVEAPDDVINLETTAVLSQTPEEMLLPLSNSENLDRNNFNILLSELHDVQSTQKSSEQQEIERSLEQAIRDSQENITQQETTVEVNQNQAQGDAEKDAQGVTQQPGNKNSNNISKQLPTKPRTTMSQTRKITPPSQTTQKSIQKQQQAMEKQTALTELTNESEIMSQLETKSQTTQQPSTSAAKEINAEGNLLLMESIADGTAESGPQLKRTTLKSAEIKSSLQRYLKTTTKAKPMVEIAEQQPLNTHMKEALVQQEQLIADEVGLAELTQIRENEASAQQQEQLQQRHGETALVDELSAEMVAVVEQPLVEEEGEDLREVERPAELELVTTQLQQQTQYLQQQKEQQQQHLQQQKEQQQHHLQQQQLQQQKEQPQKHLQQHQQQIQLQLSKIKEQEKKLELQLKRHHQQGKKLYLQLKQHQQQVQQLQTQQQQFQQMLLQPKQEVSNSQSTLIEQLKQAKDQQQQAALKNTMQQQTQTTPKQTMQQQQKPIAKHAAQVHHRHQQKAQKQKTNRNDKIKQKLTLEQEQLQQTLTQQETATRLELLQSQHIPYELQSQQLQRQEAPPELLVQQQKRPIQTESQETTDMQQQKVVLEQQLPLAMQESIESELQIEEQSQQQEQVAIAHSIQVYLQQYEQETQEKEKQHTKGLFEELIEEITTANNSPEVHRVEQQNSPIETASENSFLGDEANIEFVATEFLQQQLIVTPQQYATAEQTQQMVEQQHNENEQQNTISQQPQIILQRTRTHVQEQFMFGPTITSTQALTTSNRTQAGVSKQHMTATTTTKTKTARAAKTKTATTKRKVTTKSSDYVPQLTHVFPALPVALNNKKMLPGTQASTPTTANIITLPNTSNQLVPPVVNEQTLIPKTATPQTAMLLTLPAASSIAAKNTSSANSSSYVYGLSGDSTLFNGTQLVQIIEQYQIKNRQTTQQQHELQQLQTMQQQLQLLPQTNEQQAQYVYAQPQLLQLQQASYGSEEQQQQQLQVFQRSTIEQQRLQQMSPPPLVPLQTNNAEEQQQLYVQAAQQENEQLLQQAQEQHGQTQYVLEQVQQEGVEQQYEIHQQLELHAPHEQQAQHEPPQVQLDNQQQQPYEVLTTTPYQPLVYQLLDVTQTLQHEQQPTHYHYQQQEQQEHYIQLPAEIEIRDTHIIEYKDEQELEQILNALDTKHLQELLQVNISVEHNYSKSAPKSTLPSKLLDAPKLTSPTHKGTSICRMRPNMRLRPFFFRQLETLDYFSQVTATNIADYQLQCISIDQPYLQAKIRTSHMRTLVVFDGDMLTSLLPRCTPTLLQDLSIVLQYLGQFHYNTWEQRQQRKLISKCTHRTLHTLCAQILLVFFALSSPFQTQNECLNLECNKQRNFLSAAAAATRPAVTLDDLSLAIEPSILEEMAALRCNL